jgi:hypothetical protein
MRVKFLWQILHTFNNVLANKKWDGIIVCIVLVREGKGREFRNVGGGDQEVWCTPRWIKK